jgi:predicted enzyme related to lactoylglutathione lyase
MTDASIGLVLDCSEPEALARFWSQALGLDEFGTIGSYVVLVSSSGALPRFLLQKVDEPKVGKNRMHLDIETPDVEGEVGRLEALGARRLEADTRSEHGFSWVVMADPEGNEFCVCAEGS